MTPERNLTWSLFAQIAILTSGRVRVMTRAIRRLFFVATLLAVGLVPAEATGPSLNAAPPSTAAAPVHAAPICRGVNGSLNDYNGSGGGGALRCGGAPVETCDPAM